MKILLVDDEILITKILKIKLKEIGYEDVHTATNGEEAIGIVNNIRPDLVFLDIEMPGISGLDVLKYIKGSLILKKTKVIVTGLSKIEKAAINLGADMFLSKPLDTHRIKEIIEEVTK